MKWILLLLLSLSAFSYKLTLIHDLSRSKQSFVTRNGKKDGIFVGKEATFTTKNVSIIAKAKTVTREFTQWEILNDFTDTPFRKGETVTFYDTDEYLWALTPEVIKAKYVRSKIFTAKSSLSFMTSLNSGLSESVSGVSNIDNSNRGGLSFQSFFERQFSKKYSFAIGVRYVRENIRVSQATLQTQRLLGLLEGKYYFNPIEALKGAKVSLGFTVGYGQSFTEVQSASSSGEAVLIPGTKIALDYPFNLETTFVFDAAYESVRVSEEFQSGFTQTTNLDNLRFGVGVKRFF